MFLLNPCIHFRFKAGCQDTTPKREIDTIYIKKRVALLFRLRTFAQQEGTTPRLPLSPPTGQFSAARMKSLCLEPHLGQDVCIGADQHLFNGPLTGHVQGHLVWVNGT